MEIFKSAFYLIAFNLLILCCLTPTIESQDSAADCRTLRARCDICSRSLNEGTDENNIGGALNRKCRQRVGRTYVWRNVRRCEMAYIRCIGINRNLSCLNIAKLGKMPRRLP